MRRTLSNLNVQHIAALARKPNKFRNVPTVNEEGVRFASKKEARRDAELVLLERAGKIRDLQRQPRFRLRVNGVLICTYVGDWRYHDLLVHGAGDFVVVVEDCKGVQTPAFKIKWALAKAIHPEIDWRLS